MRTTFICGFIVFFVIAILTEPPRGFPSGKVITISQGETLDQAATALKTEHYIGFAHVFKTVMILSGQQASIQQGDYLFNKPLSVFDLAWRIAHGQYGIPLLRVTIPEGSTNEEIAGIISSGLPDAQNFVALAASKQGTLFPDTYFFPENETAAQMINVMQDNFNEKLSSIQPAIDSFAISTTTIAITAGMKPTIAEWTSAELDANVTTMASILEKEAASSTDRRMIAGILWKRLALGMPLEVDSATSTYTGRGLPALPICNPGLGSLTDAINPLATPYFYYLSDKQGTIHYEKTFAQHEADIATYLE